MKMNLDASHTKRREEIKQVKNRKEKNLFPFGLFFVQYLFLYVIFYSMMSFKYVKK